MDDPRSLSSKALSSTGCLVLLGIVVCPSPAAANTLRVDRATGQVTWVNTTGFPLGTFGYEIRSESGSLNPDAWLSFTEHYDADSGGSIDPDDVWWTYLRSPTILAEGPPFGEAFLADGQVVDLGTGLWRSGGAEDLAFQYFDVRFPKLIPAPVEFFGDLRPVAPGDYNNNGLVEQQDLDLVLTNWGTAAANAPPTWTNDLPMGNIDQDELDKVLSGWGDVSASAAATTAVPEPSTAMLLVVGLATLAAIRRKRTSTG